MKKLIFSIMREWFFVAAACVLVLAAINYRSETTKLKDASDWFIGLSNDWHLFEADYREDIKNIDRLRDDARHAEAISLEWERLAMEFKEEAFDWEMKYKELYTETYLGLLSKNE